MTDHQDRTTPERRNAARHFFLDEGARRLYVDWDDAGRDTVANLRLAAGRHPDDPELATLVGELSMKSEEFRRWWARHDVIGIEPTVRHGADLGYIPVVVTDACGAGHEDAGRRALESIQFAGDAFVTDTDTIGKIWHSSA
jgi:hypothetical protein